MSVEPTGHDPDIVTGWSPLGGKASEAVDDADIASDPHVCAESGRALLNPGQDRARLRADS